MLLRIRIHPFLVLVAALAALAWPVPVRALEGTSADSAGLIQGIIANENKIHDVKSMFLRLEGKLTHTPKGIAERHAELQRQFPGENVTAERFPDLRPQSAKTLELAFDGMRLRKLDRDDVSFSLHIWDGKATFFHDKYIQSEHCSIDNDRNRLFGWDSFFNDLGSFRVGSHRFWWSSADVVAQAARDAHVEDYKTVKSEQFHGHQCYVLENRKIHRRMYVGEQNQRLYGFVQMFIPNDVGQEAEQALLAMVRRDTGKELKTNDDVMKWFAGISPAEKKHWMEQADAIAFSDARPLGEWFLEDYREIAPGFWFPMKQSLTNFGHGGRSAVATAHTDLRVTEVKVNEPLADSLFAVDMRNGVKIEDWRYSIGSKPKYPLIYDCKKDRSKAEWQKLVQAHEKEIEAYKAEEAARDAKIGQAAVDFAPATWLNSSPLTWGGLRGKVVVLCFWAAGCGPCRNDFGHMNAYHANRDKSGLVVIGVHTGSNTREEIQHVVDQFHLVFPVYVDTPLGKEEVGFGAMTAWYGVRGIPHAVVVNRDGKVAGHGALSDVLVQAEKLAK